MENPFMISKEKAADSVKEMASLMGCDYKTAYYKYTHDIIKSFVAWEEVEKLLVNKPQ